MNETWHIPRASLSSASATTSSSSSAGSHKSRSNPSTVARHTRRSRTDKGHSNSAYVDTEMHKQHQDSGGHRLLNVTNTQPTGHRLPRPGGAVPLQEIKRGSRSSQGSTDSNNSSHSNCSGSMLLTAANLERFAEIHRKLDPIGGTSNSNNGLGALKSWEIYNNNLAISKIPIEEKCTNSCETTNNINAGNGRNDTVLTIDPNLHFVKTKDVDTMSIASSTHFTMVNGIGGPQRKIKTGICSRGHQITVLILSMSMLFLIGILAAVYLLEMRAREMPR